MAAWETSASSAVPQSSWLRDVAAGVTGVKHAACLLRAAGGPCVAAALSTHAVDGWPLLPVTHDRAQALLHTWSIVTQMLLLLPWKRAAAQPWR